MRSVVRYLQFLLLVHVFISCVNHEEISFPEEYRMISFVLNHDNVKSSIQVDETRLDNVNLLLYSEGCLMYGCCAEDEEIQLSIDVSKVYNVYVISNVYNFEHPFKEDALLVNYSFRIDSIRELDGAFPMVATYKDVDFSDGSGVFDISLERLVAKINLTIEKSALGGLEVRSARLCQSSLVVAPFFPDSRAVASDEVADGDFASSVDISTLNNGGTISFYTLENCQGDLLSGNLDPWEKTPENIAEYSAFATYLELECEFVGNSLFSGAVSYRLYLGEDNCSNFDVRRNQEYSLCLMLTDDSFKSLSWKISPALSFNDGCATSEVVGCFYGLNDLYVGMSFRYDVFLSDALLDYLGQGVDGLYLKFVSDTGEGSMSTRLMDVSHTTGDMSFLCKCLGAGNGEIHLCEEDGTVVSVLNDDVRIKLPHVAFSSASDESYPADGYLSDVLINGGESNHYIYLLGDDGYNLNFSAEDYDVSMFDFTAALLATDSEFYSDFFEFDISMMSDDRSAAAAVCKITCTNDGVDRTSNRSLSALVASGGSVGIMVKDANFLIESEFFASVSMPAIHIDVCDNRWARYSDDSTLSLSVSNPSNLPLNIYYSQVFDSEIYTFSSSELSGVADYVKTSLEVDDINYIVSSYPISTRGDLYGSTSVIRFEMNEYGSPYLVDEQAMVYPLDFFTEDIIIAMKNDSRRNLNMYDFIDVSLSGWSVDADKLHVVDLRAGLSGEYESLYSSQGWNSQGLLVSSGGKILGGSLDLPSQYSYLSAYNIKNLCLSSAEEYSEMSLSYIDGRGLEMSGEFYQYDSAEIDFQIVAQAYGYVQTHPNGTWGKAQDNSCSAIVEKSVTNVIFDRDAVVVDGGAVSEVFQKVYDHSYYDSYNAIGSANNYMHHAHPTNLTCYLSARLSDGNEGMIPFNCSSIFSTLSFYHSQDQKTYSVSSSFNYRYTYYHDVSKKM